MPGTLIGQLTSASTVSESFVISKRNRGHRLQTRAICTLFNLGCRRFNYFLLPVLYSGFARFSMSSRLPKAPLISGSSIVSFR
jgi:hypothetical protein